MKPLYRTLLVIGIAMGVVATSLIFGVGQVMVMHMQERSGYDSDVYIHRADDVLHGGDGGIRGQEIATNIIYFIGGM